jgi:hypothetical protein
VAIVEDDPLMAFLEESLKDAGCDVVGKAATAADAISLIAWHDRTSRFST